MMADYFPPRKRRRHDGFILKIIDRNSVHAAPSLDETDSLEARLTKNPRSLLDIAARVAGQNFPCETLEAYQPPLDEALLKKVAFWAFPDDEKKVQVFANLTNKYNDWDQGLDLLYDSAIKEVWQVGFMLTAVIDNQAIYGYRAIPCSNCRVSITFEQQRIISSTCSEDKCALAVWCPHVIAAVVYRIRNPDRVPVHAPMTESLSVLSREQLQKLVQYAVQEDPAGVLSKVFKHLDEIRDISSHMNKMQGAPDPTFGAAQDTKSQWQLSLEKLEKNLDSDLDDLVKQYLHDPFSNTVLYHNSFDLGDKSDSRLFGYIQKALDLAQKDEVISAAQVLIKITDRVFSAMEGSAHWKCMALARYSHDLERVFCSFMLHPTNRARDMLLEAVVDFNRRGKKLGIYKVEDSIWAEIPSLRLLYGSKVRHGHPQGIFYTPLCAAEADPWPMDGRAILDPSLKLTDSDYDENVMLMIARMETILEVCPGEVYSPVCRMATRALVKLLKMAEDDCVLSQKPQTFGKQRGTTGTSYTGKGKGKGKSSKGKGGKGGKSSKTARMSVGKNSESQQAPKTSGSNKQIMSREQITYCIIYLCDVAFRSEGFANDNMHVIDLNFFIRASLQGLELSRFRTVANRNNITTAEHNWLYKVERSILDHLQGYPNVASSIVKEYIDAINSVGIGFYDGVYPLVLFEALISLATGRSDLQSPLVEMCANLLLDSNNPQEKFTLPSSNSFDIMLELFDDGQTEALSRQHRDFAAKKLTQISETFLAEIDVSKRSNHELLTKVLQNLEGYEDHRLLQMICSNLKLHMSKITHQDHIESCLKVVVHCVKLSRGNGIVFNFLLDQRDKDFILTLAKKVGISCLKLFVSDWREFFSNYEIKRLLMHLKETILECKSLPKEVVTLIMHYYESVEQHEEHACDLLSFFKPNDSNYTKAVMKILANANRYPPNALFQLAKMQHDAKKVKSEIMDKNTMDIVELALKQLEKSYNGYEASQTVLNHIDWMYKLCTSGALGQPKEISKSEQFTKMVSTLSETCSKHPEIILRVLQHLEKCPDLLKKCSSLGNTLIDAYRNSFEHQFQDCGHGSYGSVITEMVKARLHCKQYAKNGGDTKFDDVVVEHVKFVHSGKKKLQRMIDEEFGRKRLT
ncbi:unnamed protein product [Owenia fusiformis]|uniref:Uncharacterized protein n=1 Tax=Owenia fusiformis TaxID=6347 RepID=A0A8S4N1Y0_OWEFU|nr:unnamed protein product [Owenia fusiformis]